MKTHIYLSIIAVCVALLTGCASNPRGNTAGYVSFQGMKFSLSASPGSGLIAILQVASFRENGEEVKVHPASMIANGFRAGVNHFLGTLISTNLNILPLSATNGVPLQMSVDFNGTGDDHRQRTALTAGLEAGLTLGVLGNNVTHTYDYHLDTTLTLTRGDGQTRIYRASSDCKTKWNQQDPPAVGGAAIATAKSQPVAVNFDAIAAKLKEDKFFLDGQP